jgi:hypothetical protein
MNKKLRSTLLTAALLGGGLISGGLVANAYDTTDPTVEIPVETDTPTDTADAATPNGLTAQVETDTPEAETPDGTNGERPEGRREGRGGHGCGGNEAVAELLGLTPEELHDAKEAGSSLAEVAASQGVSVDDVIQTIVDEKAEHLAEEVAEGDLTQAEADARLAEIEARTADRVNGTDAD